MVRVVCDDPGFLFAWLPGDHKAVSTAEKASFLKATEGVDYADMSGCAGLCCANEPPKGGTKGTRTLLVMLPPGADAPSSGPAEFGQLGIARVEPLRANRTMGEKGRVHHAIGGGYTDKPVSKMNEAERAAFNKGPGRLTTPPVTPTAAMKEKLKGLGARAQQMASPPAPRVMADRSPSLVLGSPDEPPAPPAWTHTLQSEVKAMRDLITKSLTMQEALMSRVATLEAANAKLQESAERQERQAGADAEVVQDAKTLMEECVDMMEVRLA